MNPLEVILNGLTERKLHYDRDELKELLFERACENLEKRDGLPIQSEDIAYKVTRYAMDILNELDEIYRDYDADIYLIKEGKAKYRIEMK